MTQDIERARQIAQELGGIFGRLAVEGIEVRVAVADQYTYANNGITVPLLRMEFLKQL